MLNTQISGCMIVQDEEICIRRALESLQRVCNEIIIIDGGSTDNTISICEQYTDKIFNHPFDNWKDQKNRAIEQCKNEWILLLDADEYLNNSLANSIYDIIKQATSLNNDIISIPRLNLQDGKGPSGWPDYQKRLYRNYIRYEGDTIHENPIGRLGVMPIKPDLPLMYIIHDKTLEQQKKRNRQYYLFDPSKYPTCPEGCEDIWRPLNV